MWDEVDEFVSGELLFDRRAVEVVAAGPQVILEPRDIAGHGGAVIKSFRIDDRKGGSETHPSMPPLLYCYCYVPWGGVFSHAEAQRR